MFFTEEKLKARIEEIGSLRYRIVRRFETLACRRDDGEVGARPPSEGPWEEIKLGDHWKGRDLYLWLQLSADLPEAAKGHRLLGRFDFGRTHHGSNQGFESLLFIDGEPYQGVDTNHQEVFLDQLAGRPATLTFRLWSGLEGGGEPQPQEHQIKRAEICLLHTAADDLYYTGRAVLDTIRILPDTAPERRQLLTALDRAFRRLDWAGAGEEAFYASAEEALQALKAELEDIPVVHPVKVRCIGHTHIDVAWLWRLKHTREKAARSFSTVLRLMEQYPDYVFLQTQPQLYEYIKQDYPEIYARIKEKVRAGVWEAGGAMWLESDCNLTSGESLVRQLLFGTRFFREEFGVECRYLWLPDVFGYSWALPQILSKSGITSFMTTKISWSQYNRMPHDTFRWRGIDGSEVLTHFITTPEIEFPHETYYTYNGYVVPETVEGIWRTYRDKPVNQELLLCYGYGDGGGGVNRDMLEMRRRLERMPGLPQAVTGRADEFFADLETKVAETDQYVHVWDGELYMENHRGTYTSQAFIKKANRRLELALRETELLAVLASRLGDYDLAEGQAALNTAWKIVLRNQFHDIIPGSSIAEVYEDARLEYAEAERLIDETHAAARGIIASESEPAATVPYTVFNSASWPQGGIVACAADESVTAGVWRQPEGEELRAQRTSGGWLVELPEAPPLGFTTLTFEPGAAAVGVEDSFAWKESGITTPYYELEWNESGQLTRLYDKQHDREVLAPGGLGNVLQVFEDKPMQFDAWNIDLFYQESMQPVTALQQVTLKEQGPLRAVVEMRWTYRNSVIVQELIVYAASRRIDFRTFVDWHERHQLMKAAFTVDVRSTEATYDIQFGNVKRPTHWNTSWDYARFETVGHQWADLSDRGYGVSLLNDCKYGYDIKDNVMRLSLIKSATYPDPQADQGEHRFTYSLLPHHGDWAAGGTVQEAWSLNNPMQAVRGNAVRKPCSLFRLSADHVTVDAVKKAEDSNACIIRFHEHEGRVGKLRITSDLGIRSWQETDLMERPSGDVRYGDIACVMKPYELKTIRVHFAD
ncbi:alpha-mannosidase [Paenibacillus sp. UNCCL117]|uniref:alpha-mannosidase n=1 Tax=unclassified Paenibacillus TaxID=185978 RepID=UPI00089075D4|nr:MULTISPECIES: alpha-mannosidase [unclassified Paenibacillus]SDD63778.1 alpha-mannosidase [Paenibacillus sp. cl123]SFW58453.1 alpha-mannosidase [Paenibacillus sp. UNCCL117]